MAAYLLFVFYLAVCAGVVHAIARKHIHPFKPAQTAAIFGAKIAFGCLYGFVFLHYYHGDDTWEIFHDALPLAARLRAGDWSGFLADFSPAAALARQGGAAGAALFDYYHHLEYWLFTHGLAVMDIFSGDNYFIDVIFFETIVVWGPMLFFRLLASREPGRVTAWTIVCFFLPTILFWTSGIRAEGLLFLFLAMTVVYAAPGQRKFLHSGVLVFAGLAGLAIFRLSFFVIFLPCYSAWLFSVHRGYRPLRVFAVAGALCVAAIGISQWISPPRNFLSAAVHIQQEYLAMRANTRYAMEPLTPSPVAFARALPAAFSRALLRPWPWEARGLLQTLASAESVLTVLFFLGWTIAGRARWREKGRDPLIVFFASLALLTALGIGLVVPFPGAILRFRTITEWLWIACLL